MAKLWNLISHIKNNLVLYQRRKTNFVTHKHLVCVCVCFFLWGGCWQSWYCMYTQKYQNLDKRRPGVILVITLTDHILVHNVAKLASTEPRHQKMHLCCSYLHVMDTYLWTLKSIYILVYWTEKKKHRKHQTVLSSAVDLKWVLAFESIQI